MLIHAYYSQNYADIIYLSLIIDPTSASLGIPYWYSVVPRTEATRKHDHMMSCTCTDKATPNTGPPSHAFFGKSRTIVLSFVYCLLYKNIHTIGHDLVHVIAVGNVFLELDA